MFYDLSDVSRFGRQAQSVVFHVSGRLWEAQSIVFYVYWQVLGSSFCRVLRVYARPHARPHARMSNVLPHARMSTCRCTCMRAHVHARTLDRLQYRYVSARWHVTTMAGRQQGMQPHACVISCTRVQMCTKIQTSKVR